LEVGLLPHLFANLEWLTFLGLLGLTAKVFARAKRALLPNLRASKSKTETARPPSKTTVNYTCFNDGLFWGDVSQRLNRATFRWCLGPGIAALLKSLPMASKRRHQKPA